MPAVPGPALSPAAPTEAGPAAPRPSRRLWREWLLCLCAALVCVLLFQRSGVLERLDLALYDAVLRLDATAPHPDILIVAVDEASLQAVGRWPWPRERHAELMERLAAARPRAVALDMLFTEPGDPAADAALARAFAALRAACPVFLPVTVRVPLAAGRPPQLLRPLPEFEGAVTGLGHIHAELDADSVARSLYLHEGTAAAPWDALALRLAAASGAGPAPRGPDAPPEGTGWERRSRLLLPFAGEAGHYRTVPAASVLRGEVPASVIRDRTVLVGLTATGVGDRFATPLSAGSALTPGVEINATAVDGLLTGRMLRPVDPAAQAAAALLAVGLWMLLLRRLGPQGPRNGLWALVAFALAALVLSAALQRVARLWLPVAPWLLAALVGYLLWSWRRLAALMADLYQRAEMLHPGATAQARTDLGRSDGWQQVVQALDRGLAAERQAQRQRGEALRLLSHDLRAPQSAILALLHSAPAEAAQDPALAALHQRIGQQVHATLTLAEDFVLQLRAEEGVYDWQDIDLAALAMDVHDRAWPLAQAKSIELLLRLPAAAGGAQEGGADDGGGDEEGAGSSAGCWMRVEPRLLNRALFNLVENAIKYSPAGRAVELALAWRTGQDAVFTVTDHGRGIAPEDLPQLFEPYRRFGDTGAVAGHGLGLSLVRTVAERHGGRVQCRSTLGEGSVFSLTLPASRAVD
ncbi:CHASE2 domain-containing protein [Xenophilus sp. Marseille-Q4582]|uniref:CHASE2 domain-containing protein n=1 Tax=Xenophilus sp. Marseille-Q4582 TaxID=2866600 RepID=UPI001CE4256D|nr:CHASE2 domain-containing protein [Xenophilus sp. Marseille-Q4582]